MPAVTRILAEFVADERRSVPEPVAVEVKRGLLDLLGVTLRGSREEAARLALSYALSYSSAGPSTVVGAGVQLPPPLAGLVNGTAGHALDFDDIGLGAGHVTVAIAPAAMAVAEAVDASGSALIDAMAVGYEVASRLTRLYRDTRLGPYAAGYHKPSVYAVFGGVAAAGRLLHLDAGQVLSALGVAASQAGGLRVNFGTMTKPMHAGIANRTAVEAVQLARLGFTAAPDAIEGRFGWFQVLCREEGDLGAVIESLGDGFAVGEGLIHKLYPCCGANHYAIDAVLALRKECGLVAEDVVRVDVDIEARNLEEVLVYPWPRSGLEGKFSLAFNVAAALVDGMVTIDTFTDDTVDRLESIRDRIRVHPVADLPQNGARVVVRTGDGRVFEREQLILKGSLEDPLGWEDLMEKFTANADAVIGVDRRTQVIEQISQLDRLARLSDLTAALIGSPA